jgi:hypothetical protein
MIAQSPISTWPPSVAQFAMHDLIAEIGNRAPHAIGHQQIVVADARHAPP